MKTAIVYPNPFLKVLATWFGIASSLLWLLYRLFVAAELGLPAECFAMAQICVVLFIAPYLAARSVYYKLLSSQHDPQWILSPTASGQALLKLLLVSQIPLLCWVFLSTGTALFLTRVPFVKALQMLVMLTVYSLSAGSVGAAGTQFFRDTFFGTEFAVLLSCVLISGAFLLNPVARYVDDIQPFISPVLHLNPLIVVCCIFDGLDIFRNPLLYERTPVPSYNFAYPNPWYLIGFWQVTIGGCCLFGAWQLTKFRKHSV